MMMKVNGKMFFVGRSDVIQYLSLLLMSNRLLVRSKFSKFSFQFEEAI